MSTHFLSLSHIPASSTLFLNSAPSPELKNLGLSNIRNHRFRRLIVAKNDKIFVKNSRQKAIKMRI